MTYAPIAPEDQKTTRATRATKNAAESKRTLGEDAAPAPGHSASNLPADYRQINGWGADLDPANRPAVPRELPSGVKTVRGDVKHWQTPKVKIHMSNEQPGLTPVFGEAQPPRGLSGFLKDYAYQFGEASNRHWMTLMMANRVDVMESAIIDGLKGRPDNYFAEKAWSAKLKYPNTNTKSRNNSMTIAAAVAGTVVAGLLLRKLLHDD